jgi:hypothetical protein
MRISDSSFLVLGAALDAAFGELLPAWHAHLAEGRRPLRRRLGSLPALVDACHSPVFGLSGRLRAA